MSLSPRKLLEKFLCSAFDEDELRRFVRDLRDGEQIHSALPPSATPKDELSHIVVRKLGQYGRLDARFWQELEASRQGRAKEISALADLWLRRDPRKAGDALGAAVIGARKLRPPFNQSPQDFKGTILPTISARGSDPAQTRQGISTDVNSSRNGPVYDDIWRRVTNGQRLVDVFPDIIPNLDLMEWAATWLRMRRLGELMRRMFALPGRNHAQDVADIEGVVLHNQHRYVRKCLGIAIVELLTLNGPPKALATRVIESFLSDDDDAVRTTMIQAIRVRAEDLFGSVPWGAVERVAATDPAELARLAAYYALGSRIGRLARVLRDERREHTVDFLEQCVREEDVAYLKAGALLASVGINPALEGHILGGAELPARISAQQEKLVVNIAYAAMQRLATKDTDEQRSVHQVFDAPPHPLLDTNLTELLLSSDLSNEAAVTLADLPEPRLATQ